MHHRGLGFLEHEEDVGTRMGRHAFSERNDSQAVMVPDCTVSAVGPGSATPVFPKKTESPVAAASASACALGTPTSDPAAAALIKTSKLRFTTSSPSASAWIWPAPSVLHGGGDDAEGEQRWHWHFISDICNKDVSAWTGFSPQSSRQLQSVFLHWASRMDCKPTLRLERGDQPLSEVWKDLEKYGHQVECVFLDGRHGGLAHITAPASGGWSVCPFVSV